VFLEVRGLLDSTLIENEVVDEIKIKRKSGLTVKVDYEKNLWFYGLELYVLYDR